MYSGEIKMECSALETDAQLMYVSVGEAESACDHPRSFRGPRFKNAGFRVL